MIGKNQDPNIGKKTQFKAGESGNPDGKPPGTKHLHTLIQEIGHSIEWQKTTLKDKAVIEQNYGKNGWKALIYVVWTAAMAGDSKAWEFLAKYGYGTKIDITSGGEPITALVEFVKSDASDKDKDKTS